MNLGIRIVFRTVYPVSIANLMPSIGMIFVRSIFQSFKGFDEFRIFTRRRHKPDTEVEIACLAAPKRSDPTKLSIEFEYSCSEQQDRRLRVLCGIFESDEGSVNGVDPGFGFVTIEFHFEPFL